MDPTTRILKDLKDLKNDEFASTNFVLMNPDDIYNFHATIIGPEGRELL